jgi:hypothetical protein
MYKRPINSLDGYELLSKSVKEMKECKHMSNEVYNRFHTGASHAFESRELFQIMKLLHENPIISFFLNTYIPTVEKMIREPETTCQTLEAALKDKKYSKRLTRFEDFYKFYIDCLTQCLTRNDIEEDLRTVSQLMHMILSNQYIKDFFHFIYTSSKRVRQMLKIIRPRIQKTFYVTTNFMGSSALTMEELQCGNMF